MNSFFAKAVSIALCAAATTPLLGCGLILDAQDFSDARTDASMSPGADASDGAATGPDTGTKLPADGGVDGKLADASDAASDGACVDICSKGATLCANGGVQSCELQANGCMSWGAVSACGSHQTCTVSTAGVSACTCNPTTCKKSGDTECQSAQALDTCALDAQQCLYVASTSTCGAHQACSTSAAGVGACTCNPSICTAKGTQCQDQQTVATCDVDANQCAYVASTTQCASPQSCSGTSPTAKCAQTCTDSCALGQTSCVSGGLATCARGSNGCLSYAAPVACGSHQSCTGSGGAAKCACANDPLCSAAGNVCKDKATLATCTTDATTKCLYVSATTACVSPQVCSGVAPSAACAKTCTDSCAQGQKACVSGGLATCTLGSNGCWAYGAATACPADQSCGGGSSPACVCNNDPRCASAGASCIGPKTVLTCTADANGCFPTATTTSTDCSGADYCTAKGQCASPTPALVCTSADANSTELTVVGAAAYWIAHGPLSGDVESCALTANGATATTYIAGSTTVSKFSVFNIEIASDGHTGLYLSSNTGVAPANSLLYGTPPNNLTAIYSPNSGDWSSGTPRFAVDATNNLVFVVGNGDGIVSRLQGTTLSSCLSLSPSSDSFGPVVAGGGTLVAVDATTYEIYAATVSGGSCSAPVGIANTGEITALATDGVSVYFANAAGVFACPVAGGCARSQTTLGPNAGQVNSLVVDAVNAYWVGTAGGSTGLVRCAKGGCQGFPTQIAPTASATAGLALDSTNVYFLQGDKLYRAAK